MNKKNKLERRRLYYKLRKEYCDWEYFRIVHVDVKPPLLGTYFVILSDSFASDINIELYYNSKHVMHGWHTDYSGCMISKSAAYSLASDMIDRLYNSILSNIPIKEYRDCDSGISMGITRLDN